jgi:hypothetical protein
MDKRKRGSSHSSVVRTDVSLKGAVGIFRMPFSKLKYRADFTKTQNSMRKDIIRNPTGHPTVLDVEEDRDFAAMLNDLAGWCFQSTSNQILREKL